MVRWNALIAALAGSWSVTAMAQPITGPYVNLGGGIDFLQAPARHGGGLGERAGNSGFAEAGAEDLGVGVTISDALRVQLSSTYVSNTGKGKLARRGFLVDETLRRYGGFIDAYYDFRSSLPFIPYLGLGAGYQHLDLDRTVPRGRAGADATEDAATGGAFAYQGVAGLNYPVRLVPGLSLTAEYRLVGMFSAPFDHEYSGNPVYAAYPTLSSNLDHQALLGLRYSFGAPTQGAAPGAELAPAAPGSLSTRYYVVFFDWDRADLNAHARLIIADAAAASMQIQTTRIEISGYTEVSAATAYNQSLALRRAQNVNAELVRDGVAPAEIILSGRGERGRSVQAAEDAKTRPRHLVEIISWQ